MATDPKTVARRWFEEVWNQRRDATIDELMTPDSLGHIEGGDARGREAFRQSRDTFMSLFPDLRIEVEDIVAEGDRAAVRWRIDATHGGEGMGLAPTNRSVQARGTTWLIVRQGQIVEGWDTWNLGGLVESLRG